MARGSRAVALLCAAAAGSAAMTFVAPRLVGSRAPLQPNTAAYAAPAELEFADSATVEGEEQSASVWKWLASGVLAGIIAAAAAAAPAQALFQDVTPTIIPNSTQALFSGLPLGKAAGGYGNFPAASWDGYAVQCKDSKKYHKRAKERITKIEQRMAKIAPGGLVYTWFEDLKQRAIKMETNWGERWCDKDDGTPLVLPAITNERGSVVAPGLIFLYIAGWIGWAGRSYLQRTQCVEKELLIDLPLASMCMLSGFSWPVTAWQEIVDGKMTAADEDIPLAGQSVP